MFEYKIVLIPFPFDDLNSIKVRPAICLTEPKGNYKHVVVAFITSKTPDDLSESDFLINKKAANFSRTGLSVTSIIRLHKDISNN